MKYIFRSIVVFEYKPEITYGSKVIQGKVDNNPAFDFCNMIIEDYKLLGEYFTTVYNHIKGENVELKDIIVN